MDFLKKIQQLSQKDRKIIFWLILVIMALAMIFLWGRKAVEKIRDFDSGEMINRLDIPNLEMPKINMPEETDENIENIQQLIEEINDQGENSTTTE